MVIQSRLAVIVFILGVSAAPLLRADSNNLVALPPPPKFSAPSGANGSPVTSNQPASPNQALADLAKESVLKSLKPEYDKQENWGHQKEIVDGYHWEQRADGWHLAQQKKKVNEGTWRQYRVRLDNPEKNLQLRFTAPQSAPDGGTAFQAFLTARMWAEGIQEQWVLGVKGLNFHVEGYATIQARLDIVVHVQPVPGAGFGTIEVLPQVTSVNLELTDLTLTKVDALHGDAARELGRMLKDIVAGEIRKKEPEVAVKINAQIEKNRAKLQFSPSQIAQIGWEKIQALLGSGSATSNTVASGTASAKP